MAEKILIFDTTLRDGEQSPGVALTAMDKVEIAQQLERLGVDIIEAGFPLTSQGDLEAVAAVARKVRRPVIAALAHAHPKAVDAARDALKEAERKRIHVFLSSSDIHMMHQLRKDKDEVLEMARSMVARAKQYCEDVEFSPMDATRSDREYVYTMLQQCIEAGATTVNIPDTVGVMIPSGMRLLVAEVFKHIKIPIDVHCHNDFGLAVPNSLASVEAGGREVQVAVNGLGERAGNANLEETVMSLISLYGVKTNIKTEYLVETSRLVERTTGIRMPPNFPIVGENAFSHESGIHTQGIISDSRTFEPGFMTPEMVGHRRRLVGGKHAGSHGIGAMLNEMGFTVNKTQLNEITARQKALGDKGKEVTDADIRAIAEAILGELSKEEKIFDLEEYQVTTGNKITPSASVRIKFEGIEMTAEDTGVGPVDAALNAVRKSVSGIEDIRLKEFRLEAITGGSDALADVIVKLEDSKGITSSARAAREDIVLASVEAMVSGINKILLMRKNENNRKS